MNNEIEEKNKIKIINDLISDIDCLEPLHEWTDDINIFDILRLDRTEIRHSNMLAWLLNPNANHGLGDKLLKKFLIYATTGTDIQIMKGLSPIQIDLMELSDAIVWREKNSIDILLYSEQNKLIFAIENKIGTGEHSDQLNRYRQLLQEEYGEDVRYVLVYLSPDGLEPSDTDNWVSMNYQFVLDELNKLISIYKISEKSKMFIEDYIKAIRRSVIMDQNLKDICTKIYFKHKEALDLIFENKPDILTEITEYIVEFLKDNASKYDIEVWEDYTTNLVRFTPKEISDLYGDMGSGEWTHNGNFIGFEVQNYKDKDLTIKVVLGPIKSEYTNIRQEIFDRAIKNGYKMKGQTLRNKWKTIKTNTLVSSEKLNFGNIKYFDDVIGVPLENYLNNEMPKIVKQLLK